jgi:filamentous hemagglutinin
MNKNLFRIIFNKRRGQLMAVAETSSSQGKGSRGETVISGHSTTDYATVVISALSFAVLCALGAVLWALPTPDAHAQVVAYRNAPGNQQPTVLQTANGVPQVNIQTPSAAGVSRNIYSQFDVQSNGVILNNSRTNVQTQQGGWVQGNPWLATGSARVILNEVNSSNPSYLNGYVEVAGQRAEVVIANPSGISVNSGGFINTSKATLTTGTPIVNGGSLDGYRVQGGNIRINGNGLDLSTTDYSAILARAVQVNAGIWANELKVITGANQIDASSLGANTTPATTTIAGIGAVPSFALDVAQIGGMYAGKIHLIGTEQGLGVRSAGTIGSTGGDLILQNNGWLTTTGSLQTSANLQITTQGNITNNGTLYARNDQTLIATGSVSNSGVIAAQGNTSITTNSLSSTSASVVGAGIKTDGTLASSGNLNIATTQNLSANGKNLAAGDMTTTGSSVDLSGSQTSAKNIEITTAGDLSTANATMVASQNLTVSSADLNNSGGTLAANHTANLQTHTLSNDAGLIQMGGDLVINTHGSTLTNTHAADYISNNAAINGKGGIAAQGTTTLTTGYLNNDAGYIGSKGALTATSTNISNQSGQIQGLDNLTLTAGNSSTTGKVNNTGGLVRSAATVSVNSGEVINSNTSASNQGIEGQDVSITTAKLNNNTGAIRANNDMSITSAGTVDNTSGLISAGKSLTLQDTQTQANRTLAITNKEGTLIADKTHTVAASSLSGDGKVLSKNDLSLTLNTDFSNSGQAIANHNATLNTTGNVNNSSKLQAGNTLNLTAHNINNTATGEISASTNQVNANSAVTNRGLIDGVDTQVNANTVNNIGTGRIYGDHLSIAAVNLTNDTETISGVTSAATLAAREKLDLGISGTLTNREHALIYSVGDMAIGGGLNINRNAMGKSSSVNNNSATIEAAGNLSLVALQINNTDEHFSTRVDTLPVQTISEYQGSGASSRYVPGAEGVYVYNDESDHLHTPEGNYESWSSYNYTRTTTETRVDHSDPGKIFSGGSMNLSGGALTNDKSHIIAGGTLTGDLAALNNTEVMGERTLTDVGSVTSYWRSRQKGADSTGSSIAGYNPAVVIQTLTLTPTQYLQNTAPTSSGTQVGVRTQATVMDSASSTGAANARNGAVSATTLPTSSLYKTNPASIANYLVETDARFTNNKVWLGSDYMSNALSLDPNVTQKRLGDGFYEQKLIREQVAQLTGRRFLADYTSDEQEYKALMTSAITFAQKYNLRPGIALTAQQLAQLTSDIVWLVEQTVTLPDGSSQKVLVPQLYVKTQPGDLDGSGALLSGKDINLNLSGDLTNSGTIAGRKAVNLTAESVNNLGGRLQGEDMQLSALQDLNNVGGSISVVNSLRASAGRDLNVQTTTQSSSTAQGTYKGVDRVAGLYVSGENGTLLASAGRDLNIAAGVVGNAASGTTSLRAGNNLSLSTIKSEQSNTIVWDANNRRSDTQSQDVGSQISGGGAVNLNAGQTLSATAATVQATGALSVDAKNIQLQAGQATQSVDEAHQHTSKGFLSKTTTTTRDTNSTSTALGSNLGGATVSLNTSQDIGIKGSNVVSDNGTALTAGGNVNIEAATNTSSNSSYRQERKSGLMSDGGLSVSVGTRKQSLDQQGATTTASASTVGSVNGGVSIQAGNQYKQVGSDVLTPTGDINITAKTVDIVEAREINKQSSEQKFEQTSISVGLKGGIIDSVQAATQAVEAAKDSSSNRNRNLNALIAYAKGSDAYEQGKALQDAYDKNGVMGGTDTDGKAQPGAAAASGIKLSVGIGNSKSQSNSATTSNTAAGSTVKAGGNVSIKATGQGEGEGNLTIQGSNVSASKDISLSATKDVNILASADTESNRSSNSSSSTSVGVSVGIGKGSSGLSLDLAASRGKGQANSDSTTYNNSHVSAGNAVNITSGADTNIKGGNIKANQVIADVGGSLNVESLQDIAVSEANQKTTGIALSIPIVGTGGSASFTQSKQNSNSNYASVNEQSGIQAGDGGFTVNVKGNTDLKGATIASSDKATQEGKNTLITHTLTTSDINNSMSASASSSGVSVGTNMMDGKYAMAKAIAGNVLNNGNANQSDASTTTSAISAGNITVGNKTTDTSKAVLTDSNGKAVSTDTSKTNRTLAKADVAGLQKSAKEQQAGNMLAFNAAVAVADNGLKKLPKPQLRQVFCVTEPCSNDQVANTAKIDTIAKGLMNQNPDMGKDQAITLAIAKIAGVDGDPAKADPNYSGSDPNRLVKPIGQTDEIRNIQTVPVTVEDLKNLPNDQKVNSTVFANGIFNNEQRAGELAIQQTPKLDPNDPAQRQKIESTGTVLQGSTYAVVTEKSNNSAGEYITAGVEKLAEILGIPTPAAELKAQAIKALSTNNETGQTDNPINSIGHSRGTMTDVNTYNVLNSEGFKNPNMKVIENNPAAAQERIEKSASQVTNPSNVQIFAPKNDPVSTFVGGYGKDNNIEAIKEVPSMATTGNSVHSSPGSGAVGSNSADVNQPFSYQGLDINQLNQAKQPQTNAIVEQVQTNPKPVPIAPSAEPATKLQEQVQKDSNAQMNQLLTTPAAPSISSLPAMQVPNSRLEKLNQFKQGD